MSYTPERRVGDRRKGERRKQDRRRHDRLWNTWHRYAGSIAFGTVILVTAFGFWRHGMAIDRLEKAEAGISAEREARIRYQLAQQESVVVRATRETRQRTEAEALIARERLRAVRQANIEACERSNVLRARLRAFAAAQLAIIRNIQIEGGTVERRSAILGQSESALIRLRNELPHVNCVEAYPEVP